MRSRDPAGRVSALPSQTPGLAERAGLTRAQLDREAWAIDRDGRPFAGAAAINRALAELRGWRYAAALYRLPGVRQFEDWFYRWFAANRRRFARWGTVPACKRPGVACLPPGSRE